MILFALCTIIPFSHPVDRGLVIIEVVDDTFVWGIPPIVARTVGKMIFDVGFWVLNCIFGCGKGLFGRRLKLAPLAEF